MSAINVINGYTDGTFRPTANVTRAQMAKMNAYIVAGGEDVGNLYAGANSFTDCASHWAKGYIAYANKTGIVAGVGNGKFNPDGNVTGVQVAKMLLCALEYDATIETYTGASWSVNVMADAKAAGLLKGLPKNLDYSKPMTREQAAQMMFNALKADVVEYENPGSTITINGVEIVQGASKAKAVANTDTDYTNGGKAPAANGNKTLQLCEKYFEDLTYTESKASGDVLGRPAAEWKFEKDPIGTYAKTPDYTFVATKATSIEELLEDEDIDVTIDTNKDVALGQVVELYVNSEDKVETSVIYAYQTDKITDVEELDADDDKKAIKDGATYRVTLETLNGTNADGTYYDTDIPGFDAKTYVEDAVITVIANQDDDKIAFSEIAETIDGVVSSKSDSKSYVKVDGTQYYVAASGNDVMDAAGSDVWTLTVDPNGIVIASELKDEAETNYNYAYLLAADATLATDGLIDGGDDVAKVKLLFTDGTIKTVDYQLLKAARAYNADKPSDKAAADIAKGDLYYKVGDMKYPFASAGNVTAFKALTKTFYGYTTNSAGEYTLTPVDKTDDLNSDPIKTATVANVTVEKDERAVGDFIASTSTTFTKVDEDGNVATATGYKNFPKDALTAEMLILHGKDSDKATAIYVKVAEASITSDVTYAYYIGAGEYDNAKDETEQLFYVGGQKVTYYGDVDGAVGDVFDITVDDDNKISDATPVDLTKETVLSAGEGYFKTASGIIEVPDDCEIYQISSSDFDALKAGTLEKDQVVRYDTDDNGAVVIYIGYKGDQFPAQD